MSAAIFLILFFYFLLFVHQSTARSSFHPRGLVLSVNKDPSAGQHIVQIDQRSPSVPLKLTVDLGGKSLWVDCEKGYKSSSYKPARCGSAVCSLAKYSACGGDCPFPGPPRPGCYNNTCSVLIYNPIANFNSGGELAEDVISLKSVDTSVFTVPRLPFACGYTLFLKDLADGVKGIAGLGRGPIGLPSLLTKAFSFPRQFSLCLSSSISSNGVILFGNIPYKLLPDRDISKLLVYTPLLINPISTAGVRLKGEPSFEYFIGVKHIKINGSFVPINETLLSINKQGNGGTKISTVDKYSVLESSIYNAITRAFVKELENVPQAQAQAPFQVCYSAKSLDSTRVPPIELVLQGKSNSWTILGSNSMVLVKNDVFCLGFVDGGVDVRTSIVIGAHQIEDNFLHIDESRSRLGFSSSLLNQQTTCGDLNFMAKA